MADPQSPTRVNGQDVAAHLQPVLVGLISLGLNGKQAHWHVQGHHFISIHEQLDEVVADARRLADEIAERVVSVGVTVDGRPQAVAEGATAFPEGFLADDKVVALIVEQIDAAIDRAREALRPLEDVDLVSQDIVIEVLRTLEKHRWMFAAYTA